MANMRSSTSPQLVAVVAMVLSLGASEASWAGALPSRAEEAVPTRAADLAKVRDALAEQHVARVLAAHGLPAEAVEDRLSRLSAEELRSLVTNLDQIQAAGAVPQYIWILLGIFLAVSIIVAIV